MNSDIPIYESSEVKSTKSKGNESILSMSVKSFISSALSSKSNNKNSDNHRISSSNMMLSPTFKNGILRKSSVISNHEIPTISEINNRMSDRGIRINSNISSNISINKDDSFNSISQSNETSGNNNTNINSSSIFKRSNEKPSKPLSLHSFSLNLSGNEKRLPKDDKHFPKDKGKRLSLTNKNISHYFHVSGNFSKKKGKATSIHSVNLGQFIDSKATVKHKRSFSFLSIDPIFRKSSVSSKNKVNVLDDDYESSAIINESRQSVRKCDCHSSNHNHHHH